MNKPQTPSPRARLQQLLAIPERQRTDEEWDELNELEIMLASSNREGAPDPSARRIPGVGAGGGGGGGGGQPGRGNQPQGQAPGKKPGRKFHKRPKQRKGPQGGPGGPGGNA